MNHSLLRPFQIIGRDSALKSFSGRQKGFIIGDEMGLGKTVQALAIIDKMGKTESRFLILCPSFLKAKWQDEIERWLPSKRQYSITLASYSECTNPETLNFLTRNKYLLTVCDEVHYLKDFSAQRTRAVLGGLGDRHRTIAEVSDHLLGLSGTFPPNRIGETYPWLLRTNHAITHNVHYDGFIQRWAASYWQTSWGLQHKGVKDPDMFRKAIRNNFIFRTIDQVAPEVPQGQIVSIPVECSANIYKQEEKLLKELLKLSGHSQTEFNLIYSRPDFLELLLESVPSFTELAEFRHTQGLFKIKAIMDYFKESVFEEIPKFILFTYHRDIAQKYFELLNNYFKENVFLISGEMPAEKRHEFLKEVNKNPNAKLISTIGAIKEGFDLVDFHYSFFTETDWRVYAIDQAMGRTRRLTSKNKMFWYFFNYPKGVEKLMLSTLRDKRNDLKKIKGV